ncbi:MAG TPA: class II aldolase/adducin family protein [Propioniciclava sp.]|uniref:class II aldolase/adducin family protein n=1 Tax=Propioniciclava sp. TaxID=2038686 RepID=UPI002B91751A|nr:class II aldolase/adducin family protein [Propioniciclava sp.]HRL48262.1 class II aldolase/adducin family protein [Propioniciclava sp.]HRL79272.1 class II aldolase/adducin family protein [Propioniciclava sp.]
MGTTSYPETLAEVLDSMGAAGRRLNSIDAVEAGAGNLSAAVNWTLDLGEFFDAQRPLELPLAVPHLAGYTVLVTGSGCRLRGVHDQPARNVGAVVIDEGGLTGTLHYLSTGNFLRPTSEFNSHLGVHDDQVARRGVAFHSVIHAQPPHLTLLSHLPEFQGTTELNRAILRWEPETIVQLPEGVKFLPFMVPGSEELRSNNVAGLRDHQIVLWAKHGVMARSDVSPLGACDKIEYAETGALYEYKNLATGGRAQGLSDDELHRVVEAFNVPTTLF